MRLWGLWDKLRRFGADEAGTASVEFVILFPSVVWLIFSSYELGWITTQQVMLNRGLNSTIRDLRLGLIDEPNHDKVKKIVCEKALVLKFCERDILIELQPLTLATGVPSTTTVCIDRTGKIEPVDAFVMGVEEDIMFVRACLIVDLMMPGVGIASRMPVDDSGGFALVAQTAFKIEP